MSSLMKHYRLILENRQTIFLNFSSGRFPGSGKPHETGILKGGKTISKYGTQEPSSYPCENIEHLLSVAYQREKDTNSYPGYRASVLKVMT